MGVWPRARTATGGAGWPRSHVRVSVAWSWPKAGGLSAVARGCPRWAVSGPRPQGGEACSLQPRSRSPEPSFGPRLFLGQVRCASPREGGDALPACGCSQRSGRLQSVSLVCLGPPAEKHILSHLWPLESKRQRRSVDRSPVGPQG